MIVSPRQRAGPGPALADARGRGMLARLGPVFGLLAVASARADSCSEAPHRLLADAGKDVEYTSKAYSPGYRFVLGGSSWVLTRAQLVDASGARNFAVTYPVQVKDGASAATRDYFVSLRIDDSEDGDCNDVRFRENNPVRRLPISEDYRSFLRLDEFGSNAERLESQRQLAAQMRVRSQGVEITIAAGFTAIRELDLSRCLRRRDDSFGVLEYQPGHVRVTCFPADANEDYVSDIAWNVDYRWPGNLAALIDELIDYVYVEPVP